MKRRLLKARPARVPGATTLATYYHEAGHVVATILAGGYVHEVLFPEDSRYPEITDRKGRTHAVYGYTDTSLQTREPESTAAMLRAFPSLQKEAGAYAINSVIVSGAGPYAEARGTRVSLVGVWLSAGSQGDKIQSDLALQPFIQDSLRRRHAVSMIWEASASLYHGTAWLAVTSLVDAFKSGVSDGEEIDQIVRRILTKAPTSEIKTSLIDFDI